MFSTSTRRPFAAALSTGWLTGTAVSATLAIGFAATTLLLPAPARADQQTVKLIQLLIQKGILSPNQAKDLLKESGGAPAAGGRHHAAAPVEGEEGEPPATTGQIRVTYVPQFIRKQIADEVRAQVMDQAQEEGWAQPDALPEWTKRIKIYGDMRVRYEGDFFDKGNYNQFVNFNGINNGSPFDANSYGINGGTQANPPFLNTTENRNQFRLRARLGFDIDIDDWVKADIRFGTGQNDSPVTANQTLGVGNSASLAAGDFAKPALWLDRGYIALTPFRDLTAYAGRMYNPFLPSDLMFAQDLGFDGFAVDYGRSFGPVSFFANSGAFPLFNTAFDFSTNSDVKYSSTDAYMAALQAGATWHINPQYSAMLGVGIFDYLGTQGAVSSPCYVQPAAQYYCSTDDTRAPFVQFGNTLYAIRNIVPNNGTTTNSINPQYYGLASRFDVLNIHPRFDILTWHPIDVEFDGEFIKNLAYNRSEILTHGPTNGPVGAVNNLGNNGVYQGGDTGYEAKVTLGHLMIEQRLDWNAFLAYRYLESDATLDAIADSDFHLGGTNAQGYLVGASLGIARNTWLTLRYLSAKTIEGEPFGVSSVYVDLNARF
jgi:hypothetical protein